MTNSYENDINGLVDDIMKVAEEASASSGMEKEARIFNRKKKSELGANREKANAMFSGIGSDDSASDPKGKINRKWKRIKAKFFKKAHADTEEMIEKIAASAGTDVDVLLDYIEKIAAEEDMDGQDIVDTLYEDIEYEEEDPADEEEGEDYDEEEYEEDGEDYDEEEEVVAEMIHEAIEKVAAVSGMDGETVLEYVANVARENEVDELEVLAALEDEANEEIEKEAASVFRHAGNLSKSIREGVGGVMYGKENYKDMYEKNLQRKIEKLRLKSKDRNLADYYAAEEAALAAKNKAKLTNAKRFGLLDVAGAAVSGAGEGQMKAEALGIDPKDEMRRGAVSGAVGRGLNIGAGILGREAYLRGKKQWNAARLALDERDDLSEQEALERKARRKARKKASKEQEKEAFEMLIEDAIEKVAYAVDVDGDNVIDYVEKLAYENDLDEIEVLAELEKEAFEMLVEDAIEKVAYAADVDGDNVIDYVEKLAYENDLDEIEVLAELEKEAAPEFVNKAKGKFDSARLQAHLWGMDHPTAKKRVKIGAGAAAAAGLGYGAYKGYGKYKSRKAEQEKEAFEMLVEDAIEKVAYVAGVSGDDVIDYVEKLAYENDLDEIEVLAELEKEAAPEFVNKAGKFIGDKAAKPIKWLDDKTTGPRVWMMDHPTATKGIAAGVGLAGAAYGINKFRKRRNAREASLAE